MKRPPRFTLLPGLQVDESSHPHVLGSRVQPTSSVSTSFYLFRVSTGLVSLFLSAFVPSFFLRRAGDFVKPAKPASIKALNLKLHLRIGAKAVNFIW